MPEEGVEFMPHAEILTYEEMLVIIKLCIQKGIRKLRLTGGEPLIRKGVIDFIKKVSQLDGLQEVTLTTNGVYLEEFGQSLRESGIFRINVSMDTLRPDRFFNITRRDVFDKVWAGIEEAELAGLSPIKINTVIMRGVNDDEILDFARLTYRKSYHVRFIELMPVGDPDRWTPDRFLSVKEVFDKISTLGKIIPVSSDPFGGPARRFTLEGSKGEIGLIGALSYHFCENCNRLRLTADGKLRGCLFSDNETDIKEPLRNGANEQYMLKLIEETIQNKPRGHGQAVWQPRKCSRSMNGIGG
jgi:cyclic pyranopterin phosphate synthase